MPRGQGSGHVGLVKAQKFRGGLVTQTQIIRDGTDMVRQMRPVRVQGEFVFRALSAHDVVARLVDIRALMIESEGPSVIVPAQAGDADAMAQITLQVHSALDGVGLTAAVSTALAGADIPCNMVAGLHHDHVFVPVALADRALRILQDLSKTAGTKG